MLSVFDRLKLVVLNVFPSCCFEGKKVFRKALICLFVVINSWLAYCSRCQSLFRLLFHCSEVFLLYVFI